MNRPGESGDSGEPGLRGVVFGFVLSGIDIVARVVPAAARQISSAGHVELARLAGHGPWTVMRQEVVPRLAGVLAAGGGVRLIAAVQLVTTLGFLGLGGASASTWGSAITEGMVGHALNPWAALGPAVALVLSLVVLTVALDVDRGSR